jgi:hypothetical protein
MLYNANDEIIKEEWIGHDPEDDVISMDKNYPRLEDYNMVKILHHTTANVRFGFLRKTLIQISKLTSYIRKRCVK